MVDETGMSLRRARACVCVGCYSAENNSLGFAIGKDATEAFEDIGHSDEAREMLVKYYIGELDEKVQYLRVG